MDLTELSGPNGPAYVQVYPDGATAPGWGEDKFMAKYNAKQFSVRRAELLQQRHQTPFALVMRSVRMICIDIDGKNGGFEAATELILPPTLAETSKSGDGFHLFYLVEDTWDEETGFGAYRDRISFVQGVDIRSIGCVFHHPHQQWNRRKPVRLTPRLHKLLEQRTESLLDRIEHIKHITTSTSEEDKDELVMIQHSIESKLAADIPAGRRNTTLFGLGAEMAQAQILDWEEQLYKKGIEVGLNDEEMMKIIANVRKYG